MNATSLPNKQAATLWIPLLIAVVTTLFLFYIDEGYYDFRWTENAGNWFVFVIYVGMIWGLQLVLGWLLFRKAQGSLRGVYAGLLTWVLVAACVVFLFS